MSAIRVVGELNETFAWNGIELCADADLVAGREHPSFLRGAAATVGADADSGRWRVVRDPLGLNKLFWCPRPDGGVDFAARPSSLIDVGHGLDDVAAVPVGLSVDLEPTGAQAPARSLVPDVWWAPPPPATDDVDAAGREVRDLLDRYLAAIAARHSGAPTYVCLSGGLDSSGIALVVADHFPDAIAVSFDLSLRGSEPSEDRRAAIRLAAELGLPLLEATVTPEVLLESLDAVLRDGVDWRDFNVHAGLVNAALAAAIAEDARAAGQRPLVFTGDLANEFLVDYQEERYRGQAYYSLPRVAPRALRSFLVRGLDTSHREVGVFEAWKLALIQPYAVAVDAYMRLPESFLRLPDSKERLCRAIFASRIPGYVLSRPKARAQVGGSDQAGGVLAACVDRGIDTGVLRRRFARLHQVADDRSLDRFIRAGRYRSRAPSIGAAAA